MVQDVQEGGLPPGGPRVRLPLLEEHAARLQELGPDRQLQLEGGLSVGDLQQIISSFSLISAEMCLLAATVMDK